MPIDIPPDAIPASMSMIASVLSIASSIKNLMTRNRISSDQAIDLFKQTATKSDIKTLSDPKAHASIVGITKIHVISTRLLSQFADEARNCEDRHLKGRQDADKNGSQ